ncbi:MAG TPA: DUF1003 domain-containing protein [Blastocatellia bacterium]
MTINRLETAKKFFGDEFAKLGKQERNVFEKFLSRRRASRDVNQEFKEKLSLGQRVADKLAATMGSWTFIIAQSIVLAIWVALNVTAFINHWDPYPFILLNLALSFQAAYAAPIIMMSQNRQAEKDRLQTTYDFEIDTKAELEILQLHDKINELRDTHWVQLIEMQQRQLEMLDRLVCEICPERRAQPETTSPGD